MCRITVLGKLYERFSNAGSDPRCSCKIEDLEMRTFINAKAVANTVREELAARGVELSHSDSLEITAKAFGWSASGEGHLAGDGLS
jgi:hypothetical protein